jgi:hypothetical protein
MCTELVIPVLKCIHLNPELGQDGGLGGPHAGFTLCSGMVVPQQV